LWYWCPSIHRKISAMRKPKLVGGIVVLVLASFARAQATRPDDAVPLYQQAVKLVTANYNLNIMPPAASNMTYREYPPYSSDWQNLEKADFPANAPARALAHQARSIGYANWPPNKVPNPVMYLNGCRALANELADTALYQHTQGNDAAAVEIIRDLLHLADMLETQPDKSLIRLLVSVGIRAVAMDRLNVVASGMALTKDANDAKAVQIGIVRELTTQILKENTAAETTVVIHEEEAHGKTALKHSLIDGLSITANRVDSECGMTAMLLACHLYRFDTNTWPKSLDDLHDYLPSVPADPFGDGKQTLGYALIKHGLPDGTDRPLVYSRCDAKGALFCLNDQPHYSIYNGDGSDRPRKDQKPGGQFRDVASWVPTPGHAPTATTQPVE
jgi:hypothetical protein